MKASAVLLALCLLAGCGVSEPAPTAAPTAVPTPVPAAATAPAPTFTSYTLPLDASVPIYSGPGYDTGSQRTVGQDGVYTIVEEAVGTDGSVWGRLKSGVGWVELGPAAEEEVIPPFTADFAFPELLRSGDFARCVVDNGEGSVQLMILPHELIRDVWFEMLAYDENGYAVDCICDKYPELSAARPLVADVVFYGDMTAYGLSFVDESGERRRFAITLSGFDGSLMAEEY